MKLLLENWREFLKEGMKTANDIPDNYVVYMGPAHYDNEETEFSLVNSVTDEVIGYIAVKLMDPLDFHYDKDDPEQFDWCTSNKVYNVVGVRAKEGWGPLLYDLAMEYATSQGGWLTPHKEGTGLASVSGDALRVWQHYFNWERYDEIMKIPEGLCHTSNTYSDEAPYKQVETPEALKHIYRKNSATLDSLNKRGILKKHV
jgi:hypothetical protein